jgi:1-acyl-sn-glycerol-3-phosphate acyltransferase
LDAGDKSKFRWYGFLLSVAVYWLALPALILFMARKLDVMLSMRPLAAAVSLPIGSILLAISLMLSFWCAVTFYLCGGGFPLAFLPPERLVKEGPYSLSRHPLYSVFTVHLIGLGLIIRSPTTIAIIAPGSFLLLSLYALIHEERLLLRRYGDEYQQYKTEVPFFGRVCAKRCRPGVVFSIVYLIGKCIVAVLFPVKASGTVNLPRKGPYILVCNHASYLDPVFLIAASNRYVRFFTTGEMMRTPIKAWLFRALGSISTSRYRVDSRSVRAFLSAIKEGEIVGIFPEGERTWDGNHLPINPTVRRLLRSAQVPLIPARIEGSYAAYPRWSSFPLPSRITVRFFESVDPENTPAALSCIRDAEIGHTCIPRDTRGLERLIWACPACSTIGSINSHGRTIICTNCQAWWRLDRHLNVHSVNGSKVHLPEFASSLKGESLLKDLETMSSVGQVRVLAGEERLAAKASGQLTYQDQELHVSGNIFSLSGARILRVEGKDRLDVGFPRNRRLRLIFHRDSPVKWQRFLQFKLGVDT